MFSGLQVALLGSDSRVVLGSDNIESWSEISADNSDWVGVLASRKAEFQEHVPSVSDWDNEHFQIQYLSGIWVSLDDFKRSIEEGEDAHSYIGVEEAEECEDVDRCRLATLQEISEFMDKCTPQLYNDRGRPSVLG